MLNFFAVLFIDIDNTNNDIDIKDFVDKKKSVESIYEFLYIDGHITEKGLVGKWTPPPSSPTNAALLWPHSIKYFLKCIKNNDPEYFSNI